MKFTFLILILLIVNIVSSQNILLKVENLKPDSGQICVAVFDSHNSFKKEKPVSSYYYKKTGSICQSIQLTLPTGTWGISVLDDINANGKIDYRITGLPKEGFGFAGYYHKGIFKPSFEDFQFSVKNENEKQTFSVVLRRF